MSKVIAKEIFINAFPASFSHDIETLLKKIVLHAEHDLQKYFQINLGNEYISIPYRVYYEEPIEKNLSPSEVFILNCLFTRHHNGYVREKHLKKIIHSDNYIATPFIVQLIGEYTIEILQEIKSNLSPELIRNMKELRKHNLDYFHLIEQRVQSYWNCYYKSTSPNKADYVGFQILNSLEA